ncbi:glycolate oxidase subunit GlcE [Phenylobacterium sp. J367]|uniref:glycolate oxidase subunit GlcE n=1 Tax=Phenylobacterium sp. J367 TaxID=2898435 RepID=UPI0021507660|nr:glycolate oxidase subunit GlcE [Phenylobacterium sp. J367]MCR5881104.1 glycolate oxidase subunit GlcE [Phenylobacterium sp. J367]
MAEVQTAWTAQEAAEVIRAAAAAGEALELVGQGTKRGFGRPVAADTVLDLSGLAGIVRYEPEELVLTLKPGTPMAEVDALLAEGGQMLAFEPPDLGPLFGQPTGQGTIGGAILCGRGGPRRLSAGAPRDHCLGVKAVNGLGDAYAGGGRVVKNVTGFDLPKLIAGSFGTLGAVTELTVKVLPAPETSVTLRLEGLSVEAAVTAMAEAMGTPAQVSAAAFLPAELSAGASQTLLRLEGFGPSVAARAAHLRATLAGQPFAADLGPEETRAVWKTVADAAPFANAGAVLWRLSVPPSHGPLGARLAARLGGRYLLDWAGGGIWLELPPAPDAHAGVVRSALHAAVGHDGHATLVRAPEGARAAVDPFDGAGSPLETLTARVKAQFDPGGVLNPGRMYAGA